ncbi:MAG: ABC transporter permease [Chloroflexia bacterium]
MEKRRWNKIAERVLGGVSRGLRAGLQPLAGRLRPLLAPLGRLWSGVAGFLKVPGRAAFFLLALFFSLPWAPVALATPILGRLLPRLYLVLVGLGVPILLGIPALRLAGTWLRADVTWPVSWRLPFLDRLAGRLRGRGRPAALCWLILGGLWAVAGPLSALNLRYGLFLVEEASTSPLALALAGTLPPLLGLLFVAQAEAAWREGRARIRGMAGGAFLAVGAVAAVLGLLAGLQPPSGCLTEGGGLCGLAAALLQGHTMLLLSWFLQAALLALMAALFLERRAQAMGAFFIALGLLMALLFVPGEGLLISSFVLNLPGTETWPIGDAVFPSGGLIVILVTLAAGLGAWQTVREIRLLRLAMGGLLAAAGLLFTLVLALHYGLSTGGFLLVVLTLALGLSGWQILRTRETNGVLGAILLLFLLAFLIWASSGRAFNLTGMLAGMLEAATPIALGALSGVWCERSAVINIGIEGMMLSAAFTGVVAASASGSLLVGLLAGMLIGGLLGALLALLAIRFKVNQIIAGTAINIFATGATSFLSARVLAENQALNRAPMFPKVALPVLSRIPVVGPVFFNNNLVIYLMLILVVVTHIILFSTRWGLRSRSVGEHPLAADTLGVNVLRTRYINVIIGGLVAGLGGVYFTLGSVARFDEVMTAGRGFIGLAAMIFGRWTPCGAFGSSLIFGFASALQMKMSILRVPIPSEFLLMAPYLATIIVLAGIVGRAIPPAADGQPYEKQ